MLLAHGKIDAERAGGRALTDPCRSSSVDERATCGESTPWMAVSILCCESMSDVRKLE